MPSTTIVEGATTPSPALNAAPAAPRPAVVRASDAFAAQGLTKRYGNTTAVDNLSLHVRRGEIYAFLGLNGAGKTTTIRMLLGMVRPSAGGAEIFGTPIRVGVRALWSRVGYLVETPHSYPELTVREN